MKLVNLNYNPDLGHTPGDELSLIYTNQLFNYEQHIQSISGKRE